VLPYTQEQQEGGQRHQTSEHGVTSFTFGLWSGR
jgi:hypothetical protein